MRKNIVKTLIAAAATAAMVGSAIPVAAYADAFPVTLEDGTIVWIDEDGYVVDPPSNDTGTGNDNVEIPTIPPSVADAVVTLGRTSYAYDGTAKDPGVASVTFHGQELVEGVDYRVDRPAGRTNAGTYTYVVRGVNNFVGTARASFTITPEQVKPRVKLSKKRFVWDGRTKVPGITVLANGKVLVEGRDYYTNIPGNKKSAGVYLYGVKLKGNYEGWEIMSYEIVPKATTAKRPTAGTRSLTARWRRQLRQVTGYEVQCGTRRSFRGAKTVRVKGAKRTSKRIGKLESGKRYYVRVRTYKVADGQTVRSAWSKAQSVVVL